MLPLAPTILAALAQAEPPTTPGLTFHGAPRPLADGAVTEDWPSFRGPRRDGIVREAPLDVAFPESGPGLVWELERGEGLASPVIADGRLVFTHRVAGSVHVDCHRAATGERLWRHSFPCDYSGRYFDNGGPRATPTIAGERVVVHGVGGRLVVLDLESGDVVWDLDTAKEMKVGDDFFGVVSSPLVVDGLVVQNVGAPGGPSVAAFDLETGELRWGAGTEWGPSCASPVPATLGGERRILVLAGGESRPPTGGLMVLSPKGELTWSYPFRSRTTLSVNGASPLACGDGVFLTVAYGVGSALLRIDANGKGEEIWRERRGLALEFSTPVYVGDEVIGIDGASGQAGAVVAIDPANGDEVVRQPMEFETEVPGIDRLVGTSLGKGSLVHADGHFWILGDTGELVVARRSDDGFEEVAHASLFFAPETWTPPVIANGLLYVCQNNPERDGTPRRLLCFDVRGR
ncbi:MAG: PQQ-binding-like beta-propeller repeat protein [Planctomycetota bacterium]